MSEDHRDELREMLAVERAARAHAERENRLKDQFIAVVSHELRTPLTTMLLWDRVLADETATAELRARALDAIRESAQSQSRLVGDLLDISRAISGKLFIDLRPLELEPVLGPAVAAIATQAKEQGVTLVHHAGASGGVVLGDAARLRQVFDNLLSNALKFSQRGGTITITVASQGPLLSVEVADTGRGIPADFLDHIFEPFSQTDDKLSRRAGGLGLGLAIAKQLVELHDGTLTADSSGAGRGATFTVVLPLAPPLPPAAVPGVARRPSLAGIAVLVVDDDRRVRDALALLLERAGGTVRRADSAQAARTQVARQAPDVIVCDIAMPGEDGYQFIETLRRTQHDLPVIAVTAHASESDSYRARLAGFDLHVAKPIDIERLVTAIHALVIARRAK